MRLAYPVRVMVTTTSSRAMRSSIETSPSNGTILRAPLVAPLGDDLGQLLGDDLPLPLRLGQDVLEVGDLDLDLGQLVDDLLPLQRGQPAQLHVEDRGRLDLVDVEQLHQALASPPRRVGERRIRAMTSSSMSSALTRPRRMCARSSALRSRNAVRRRMTSIWCVDVVPDELGEVERARHAVDQRQHVGAERLLQLGVLVEVVQHHLGDRVALEHQHEPHAGTAAGLVADVGDAGELALLDQLGDALGEVVRVDLVGQLGDDEAGAARACPPRPRRRPASGSSRGRSGTRPGSRRCRRSGPWSGSPDP